MRRLTKHIGTVLVIGGLLLFAIPVARWAQTNYFQRQALAALENEMPAMESMEIEEQEITEIPDGLPPINGILEIPKLNVRAVVVQGVTEEHLKLGPGFYPQSKYPEIGNVSIASHRGSHGSFFLHVDKLDPGDEIFLTLGDKIYRYSVREQFITHSRDWSVIESGDNPELTLTTCIFTTLTKRLIVKADLAEVKEAPQAQRLERQ